MLVLSRKEKESIIIGENIELTVLGIEEGKVKLGIKAPRYVSIHRKEVYLEIQEENKKAASGIVDLGDLKKIMRK
ncbi:MAG: carbon storage regulator CsrA [Anaeromicrobium sp.]|jgi:carbon storage regulator|uniref:carbon storage regulator CsrA n=1 Tax=Anaeromicrobium sp. TaxID=1929132 RepID=UPI0025CC9662|nr:carbon storage regulator CsrA [Anaeromicrobium sp.]MCT4595417.1 carbon storage regulator CsrA [Anaeromicrobium sp.]